MSTANENETVTVRLEPPAMIDGHSTPAITLRAFTAGELVGIDMADLARLSVTEVAKIAPRISSPALTPEAVYGLAAHHYLALAGSIAGFFTPPGSRAQPGQAQAGGTQAAAISRP